MAARGAVTILLLLGTVGMARGERWLIERSASADLAPGDAWAPAAAELLLRRHLAELRGVTLLSKDDVKSDVQTLELNRLSAVKPEQRILLGQFTRSTGLIRLEVGGREQAEIRLLVMDLTKTDSQKLVTAEPGTDGMERAAGELASASAEFLGRTPRAGELARMRAPTGLSQDALVALAGALDAKTPAERELLLKQATTLSPRAPLTWYLYAQELHAAGRSMEAVTAYRGAIKLDDSQPRYHYDLGNAFFDEKRHAEAAHEYERTIALDPAHAPSHENLIRSLEARKLKGDAALAEYRRITAACEKTPVVQLQTGRLLAGMKKYDEAVKAFHLASDLDPADPVVHYDLAHVLEQAGREDEAFYEYKEAVKLAPNYAKALNNAGFLYEKKSKPRLALYYYQMAVKYAPDYALAWNNLGILYGRLGQNELEADAFTKQTKLTPDDPLAWFNLGVARHRQGEMKLAIECYKKVLALRDDDRPTHWQLAHAYEREGAWNLADNHWRRVLALDPTPEEKATAEKHIRDNYRQ